MKTIRCQILFLCLFLISYKAHAFSRDSWSAGLSYFSQNFFNEITQSSDGSTSFLGTSNYALDVGYESGLVKSWMWSARLLYTPLPRSAPGNTADVTLTQLKFLTGQNFEGAKNNGLWDWYVGLGLLKEDYKGKGGTVQMNNGTGTATFAVPGNSSSSLNGTQSVGVGYSFSSVRITGEIAFENLFNEKKRTQNLIIGVLYLFETTKASSRGGR